MNTRATFEPGRQYHVYNKTNNGEALFKDDENRRFFLRKFKSFSIGFFDIYAYSLLSNHFHVCISCFELEEIFDFLKKQKTSDLSKTQKYFLKQNSPLEIYHELVSHQFQRFFTSYTMSFNKYVSRDGNLLKRSYNRSLIKTKERFAHDIYYIHHNARKHNVVTNFQDHKWNSYQEILTGSSIVNVSFMLEWFGGKEQFIEFHKEENEPDRFR